MPLVSPVLSVQVPLEMGGQRLDQAAAELFPEYSRSRLKQWIESGLLRVEGGTARPKARLLGGETLALTPPETPSGDVPAAEPIAFGLCYEDEALLVVDKPAGLVVHPGAGNPSGTLVNGLLHLRPELSAVPRAGIVHRLDKDTTGLMVVAKTLSAHHALVEQLSERRVRRCYQCVVGGVPLVGGTVDQAIGRDPRERTRMAVRASGKPAVTHYRVCQRFARFAHLEVHLETGRTHQIRVHLASIGHPLVGDPQYGGRNRIPADTNPSLAAVLRAFNRQALHASELDLIHPKTLEPMAFKSPLPQDMRALLAHLQAEAGNGSA